MTNAASSFPSPTHNGPLHRHGGRIDALGELPIHALGDDYTVVGNGTVLSLPALNAGLTVALSITGTQTFKNSARLICPNGVDYVAGPGDLAVARSSGDGVWRLFVSPASGVALADRALSLSSTQQTQVQKNVGIPAIMRSYLAGLTLSTAGASTTFGIAAGVAADSTNADIMSLAAAYTKTTGSWALGSGNGALDTGSVTVSTWYHVFSIKRPDTGVVEVMVSLAPGTSSAVAISNASPANVNWNGHGLQVNTPIVFSTTGALPTGLTAGTQYYVKLVSDVNNFSVSLTQGGAAVATSSAGSGTHTATSNPILANANAAYTLFRRIGSMLTNGSSQWVKLSQLGDEFLWDVAGQDAAAAGIPAIWNGAMRTDTNRQIRLRASASVTGGYYIQTRGWIDRRGKDA